MVVVVVACLLIIVTVLLVFDVCVCVLLFELVCHRRFVLLLLFASC